MEMASTVRGKAPDAVKLFVGQVPKHMTQEQLLPIFQEAGNVFEINIIKDKSTKQSRGCCFLTYGSRVEADTAVHLFHNKRTIAPLNSPLQVKYADGELERLEHKLFIGMLPKFVTDAEVRGVFSSFGTIKELQIIKGSQQTAKACAFLKFEAKEQAAAAVDALNGVYRMEGSTSALVVKWADTEKEKQARKVQKAAMNTIPKPSLFGAIPQGYVANSFNSGFNYQTAPYGAYSAAVHQSQSLKLSGTTHQSRSANGMGLTHLSGYSNGQYQMPYQGSMFNGTAAYMPPLMGLNSTKTTTISPQTEGPPGANLFIYHIPAEFGDVELSTAFSSFGNVVSAKVFVDKATGISKCFGFVSYDSPDAAQAAINVMNGFQLSGKRLKVQLKRDSKQSKPY